MSDLFRDPVVLPLAPGERRPLPADVSVAQGLGRRAARRARRCTRSRSCSREEGLLERTLIYATDINPEALRTAEAGVFDVDAIRRASAKTTCLAGGRASLSDYYTRGTHLRCFDRSLKKAILFSDHSLATDSVFAEVQLVSCRNVLIYFDRELQDRALGVLRDSLCRRGFLGLGPKETLRFSPHAAAFTEFAPEERIYQRI